MTKNERKPESGPRQVGGYRRLTAWIFPLEDQLKRNLMILALGLLLTLIIVPKGGFIPDYYVPGDIASRDIKAPADLLVADQDLTEKKRHESEEAVRPLYDFDPSLGRDIAERLARAIAIAGDRPVATDGPGPQHQDELHKQAEEILGLELSEAEFAALAGYPDTGEAVEQLRQAIEEALQVKIVGNVQLFAADREQGLVVRNLDTDAERPVDDLEAVVGLEDAFGLVEGRMESLTHFESSRQRELMAGLVRRLLRPNLTFNKNETEARKRLARKSVTTVFTKIKKGEMIVREGERVSPEQIKKLKALRDLGRDSGTLWRALGVLVTLILLLYTCDHFARRNVRKYRPKNRDLLFLMVTIAGLFLLLKVAIFVATALESAFPYIDSSSYYYLFPFAAGAMLVRLVLNSEVAMVFAAVFSLLVGILFGNSLPVALYALAGSMVGAHWLQHCKERSRLYRAGVQLALANALLVLGLHLMAGRLFDVQLLFKLGFGLGGGILCAVVVTGLIPLVEAGFKYTTDIKLLELANMNNPVLRELMIQAPGTYHHSIIVGNLAEAAAETINANPLLARVAAYYHDIGKIRKPLYFVENTGGHRNRHEKLAPSMSALILMAHVRDGVDLARSYKLGEPLIDILRQHHGTSLIKYFYDKAKQLDHAGVQQIDERDYRYPGPKPQTREAALIMLADAVEAASRTLTNPTPARIRGMVQKIVNNFFTDGQLDECELTLKNLHNIAKSFNRILGGIFHHRIDYPEPVAKGSDPKGGEKKKTGEDLYREPPKEVPDSDGEAAKGSAEDLKRLGMS